jgi:chromosome segregation ATPase
MNQRSTETSDAILKFAAKDRPIDDNDPTDQSGRAVVALLQQAATMSTESTERAMTLAHKLSVKLREAEDQINDLRNQLQQSQNRATRAEEWLQVIRKEIEERLLVPRVPARLDPTLQ